MPRPRKCRRVCFMPQVKGLIPICESQDQLQTIIMTIDEYEVIRLIDLQMLTQEECADQMGIARTTVTGIYNSARIKLAHALVNGNRLLIEGGDFCICEHRDNECKNGQEMPFCRRRLLNEEKNNNKE